MQKYCALITLFAGATYGADFVTGQAARAVIGQPTFSAQVSGASDTAFGGIGGLAYAANTLFATDSNRLGLLPDNNRVLLFNNIQQMIPAADTEIPAWSGRCPVCGGRASIVLGQPGFDAANVDQVNLPTQANLRLPTAVASDGNVLAVADTANNRVMIWKSIPTTNGQPADVVLGQPDFTTMNRPGVTASSMRGPQGVWIQNGKLFVADTQNNRILIWNSIPTQNNQPADLVLGQPNFTTSPPVNQIQYNLAAAANTMLSPVSVTSDGTRLYVTDLGFSRVLIWNSIPSVNQQPADVEIGQKDFTQSIVNDSMNLCASNGTDSGGNPTYPALCAATLNFPRYALSDGQRLFVADGGNDRILVFNQIPNTNAASADVVLGQPDEFSSVYSANDPLTTSAANITPTPTSLAWDGQNLYVADATDYRILVFSPGQPNLPINSVVNAASRAVYAAGSVVVGGTLAEKNTTTVTINGTAYTYTVGANDTLDGVAKALTNLINAANDGAGDPNVFAYEEDTLSTIRLIARKPGTDGNNVTLTASVSTNSLITLTASGATLNGGGSAGNVAPGTVVLVRGTDLAESEASADSDAQQLPFELAGVQLYFDGIRAPLFSVSPTEIRAQMPFLITGAVGVSAWIRTQHADGSVTVSAAVNVPILEQNPGIFADETVGAPEPRAAVAVHASSYATGTISVSGGIQAGDTGTITIGDNTYTYTVKTDDTLDLIRDTFVNMINGNPNEQVTATGGQLDTIRLQAKVPGPEGNGISLAASTSTLPTNNQGVQLTVTATNTATCCASVAGAPVTPDNPAAPGETIIVYATGLGLVTPEEARLAIVDGARYAGPADNAPRVTVYANAGGASATVLSAALAVGQIGIYEVVMEINPTVVANPQAQLTISQSFSTSNIVTVPIGSPPLQ
jgi:uncharacterized protein (TIGR03437 family)